MQHEHGGFRHISEDILAQEIASAKDGENHDDEAPADADATTDSESKGEKGTKEHIIAMKAKMVQHLAYVCSLVLLADFLLIFSV